MATLSYKPVLYVVPAFDAQLEFTFTFSYVYGSLQDNTILIKDNQTGTEIYRNKITSRQLRHTLPANTLTNGKVYSVQIQVTDTNGDISQFSDPMIIYCFTTPTFTFANVSQEQTLTSSYYRFDINYSQLEGELLNQYTVILYNSNRIEINNSGSLYDTSDLGYTFYNLTNNEFYYIRATGVTVHNMTVDTGYIYFNISYLTPPVYTLLGLENLRSAGAIRISPNIKVIGATCNPDPPIYIDDKEIDLTGDGSYVDFEDGFQINDNFLIQSIGRDFTPQSTIMELSNGEHNIKINYRIGNFEGQNGNKAYIELKAYNVLTCYYQMSNYIDIPTPEQYIYMWIKRQNNRYELIIQLLGGGA